jgi:DNA adenine methylase
VGIKPFLKWAGGKRWLAEHADFALPSFAGRYIEPFLGGGAMYFATQPKTAILSDANEKLVETYHVVRNECSALVALLKYYDREHCSELYYRERSMVHTTPLLRAAQFIYLNRACWNGLYRVNLKGQFNVPIGTKDWIVSESDDFPAVSLALADAEIYHADFEESVDLARDGDLLF